MLFGRFSVLVLLLLKARVALVSAVYIHQEEFNFHNVDIAQAMTEKYDSRELFLGNSEDRSFGERCGALRSCGDGLDCSKAVFGKRCFPRTCIEQVASEFQSTFDFESYKKSILDKANLSEDDLFSAKFGPMNFEEFQETSTFQALVDAFDDLPIPGIDELHEAANGCISDEIDESSRGATTKGTIVCAGLHFEATFLADTSLSIFWALGDEAKGNSYIRGCFGAEFGSGAEISFPLGKADEHVCC